jgi:inorganic pyrophosphatase
MAASQHPWHDLSPGTRMPEYVNGIIEIPKGSRAKYEVDKASGLIRLDRVLYSSMYYPANYGFIPKSYCGDKDPLDILVLTQVELVPLCLVEARVIGVMRMLDNGDSDDKIIAVAAGDPSVNHIRDIRELPPHFTSELRNFFEEYKRLENRTVVVDEFLDHQAAQDIVREAIDLYAMTFPR